MRLFKEKKGRTQDSPSVVFHTEARGRAYPEGMPTSLILQQMLRGVRALAEDLSDQDVLTRLQAIEQRPPPILLDEQVEQIKELGDLVDLLRQRVAQVDPASPDLAS